MIPLLRPLHRRLHHAAWLTSFCLLAGCGGGGGNGGLGAGTGGGAGGGGDTDVTNNLPTISAIAAQGPTTSTTIGPVSFTVWDMETPAASLILTASSSNTALVPQANLVLGGSGTSRTVTMTRISGQSGSTTITLTVIDAQGGSASSSFTLTVAVDDPVFPAPVARTGQTASYFVGDDGALRPGTALPTPRFADNGDGTITDHATGLIWLKNANPFGRQNWANALSSCAGLNSGEHGLTDGSVAGAWRLPNIVELRSLIDFGQGSGTGTASLPAGHPFIDIQPKTSTNTEYYWSGTTNPGNTSNAFAGDLYGTATNLSKTLTYFVWPVRGGAGPTTPISLPVTGQTVSYRAGDDGDLKRGVPRPTSRFIDNNDQTVTDTMTGLMWHRNPHAPGALLTWTDALTYCNNLVHATHDDWRLPSVRELDTLTDAGEYNSSQWAWTDAAPFASVPHTPPYATHWTSTSLVGSTATYAWAVDFYFYGTTGVSSKTNTGYVWPVRNSATPLAPIHNN